MFLLMTYDPSLLQIRTSRLWLRPFTEADLPSLLAISNEPEVRRYLWDDTPVTEEKLRKLLEDSRNNFAGSKYGLWVMTRIPEGDRIGFSGLFVPSGFTEIEIVFEVTARLWNRGYATEAAAAVLRHGWEVCGLPRIVGKANPENPASERILRKIGMTFEQEEQTSRETLRVYAASGRARGKGEKTT